MAERVKSSSTRRVELAKALPLRTPFALHVFPSYFCDFKCCYCIHSLTESQLAKIPIRRRFMNFDVFRNAIDGACLFQDRLKLINFAGHGEPLLNRDIAKMIAYAKEKNIADKIELVTNANNLTEHVSDSLIEAGLDSLRISIQGVTKEKYQEVSRVKIDFDRLVDRIGYFYAHKKQCSVYIKIIDAALDTPGDEKRFMELFGGVCDRIAVEHLVPTASGVDYSGLRESYRETQQGYEAGRVAACPMPFYMMIVEPDGEVRTCCATRFPVSAGNACASTLYDIWNGEALKEFWKMHLEGGRDAHAVCRSCSNPDYGLQPGDNIDGSRSEILERINGKTPQAMSGKGGNNS